MIRPTFYSLSEQCFLILLGVICLQGTNEFQWPVQVITKSLDNIGDQTNKQTKHHLPPKNQPVINHYKGKCNWFRVYFQKHYINLDKKLVLEYWWFWNDEEAVLCKIAAASAWIKAVAPNLTGCHCIVHYHVLTVKNKMKQKKESPSIT